MLTNIIPRIRQLPLKSRPVLAMFYSKDTGDAGSIRGAGGAFAEKEKAQENQYFNKLQKEQLKKLKGHLQDEISHHEAEIKRHQEAIAKQKKIHEELEKAPK